MHALARAPLARSVSFPELMNVVHLTDSPFFGGPERQMLGLAVNLPKSITTTILCFRDNGSGAPFVHRLGEAKIDARMLTAANPHFVAMVADVVGELKAKRANVLVTHGYKADILGFVAARIARVPILAVSRGWTGHTRKVRLNEALDRLFLRHVDGVVCVSDGQAVKIRRAGIPGKRVHVIRNAIDTTRFAAKDPASRATLQAMFPAPRDVIVAGVGRLSPEKGFDVLIEAARLTTARLPGAGFVLLGDGPERQLLEERVRAAGLQGSVAFAGFRSDVDRLLPGADILAQSSHTEGLPNVVLEACAAGIPVVATAVGGTGEVIRDGVNGFLVEPGNPVALADRLLELMVSPDLRQSMGESGRQVVRCEFSFADQCAKYERLFASSAVSPSRPVAGVQRFVT